MAALGLKVSFTVEICRMIETVLKPLRRWELGPAHNISPQSWVSDL